MIRRDNSRGFTLIELMLAMAFIAFVLLFVVTTLIQVMRTYNKGLVIKEINQTARTITEDMARILRTTSGSSAVTSAIPSGRLCFGGTSYVWNIAGAEDNRFTDGEAVTFARVVDPGSALCSNASGSYPPVNNANATPLITDRVWVQDVELTINPFDIADIQIKLSTADNPSSPALINDPVRGAVCKGGGDGEFCATAEFSTSVQLKGSS